MDIRKLLPEVLKLVHPEFTLSRESSTIIEQMLSFIYQQIKHITPKNIREILCQVISEELLKHAISEYRSGATGHLTTNGTPDRVIEYLTAEILELSGMGARDRDAYTIDTFDVYRAIMNDTELYGTFHKLIPIFPYLEPPVIGANTKLILPKNKQKFQGHSTSTTFKMGINNILRCIVNNYNTTDPTQLILYADAAVSYTHLTLPTTPYV